MRDRDGDLLVAAQHHLRRAGEVDERVMQAAEGRPGIVSDVFDAEQPEHLDNNVGAELSFGRHGGHVITSLGRQARANEPQSVAAGGLCQASAFYWTMTPWATKRRSYSCVAEL